MSVIWTESEDAFLRANKGQMKAHEIGQHLGRTARSVHRRCSRLGIAYRKPWTVDDIAKLGSGALAGDSARMIAADTGRSHGAVYRQLDRRGLRLPNYMEIAGGVPGDGPKMVAIQKERWRQFAKACGWPEDLAPIAVKVLNWLHDRGPQTRRQIYDGVGSIWRVAHHLGRLQSRGLVASMRRVVRRGGTGRNLNLYTLALTAERGVG